MRRFGVGVTDIGRRRVSNEDAYFVDDELGLYAVADGMGGHKAGEVASQEAIDTLHGMVKRGEDILHQIAAGNTSEELLRKATRLLESAVQAATYMVFSISQVDPNQQGMGTTLSALLVCGKIGITAQVGDSRVYLVREGVCSQLTEDHTLIAWQMKQGIITAEQAAHSPHKNVITRAVGSREYVQVDTAVLLIQPGDAFLLCSDGLHGYVRDESEIPPMIELGTEQAARSLVDMANERGGRDNITAVVIQIS
ncbi:MAG: serine/threonine-protein phosphatase [Sandaracinaceae bacterium]|nr:serine/threonine-protein phosphatase [Sandaracinaceae bacterium]